MPVLPCSVARRPNVRLLIDWYSTSLAKWRDACQLLGTPRMYSPCIRRAVARTRAARRMVVSLPRAAIVAARPRVAAGQPYACPRGASRRLGSNSSVSARESAKVRVSLSQRTREQSAIRREFAAFEGQRSSSGAPRAHAADAQRWPTPRTTGASAAASHLKH